jgi:hypothetical protein
MDYAIAAQDDLVTGIPAEVLDLVLIMALDQLRDASEAGKGLDGYGVPAADVASYLSAVQDVNAEIQAHAEMHAEDGPAESVTVTYRDHDGTVWQWGDNGAGVPIAYAPADEDCAYFAAPRTPATFTNLAVAVAAFHATYCATCSAAPSDVHPFGCRCGVCS